MLEEISFLQDIEQNDGRLMLFQLPALLPVAAQAGADGGAGTSVAASRPAHLRELPTSKIGKLLVFESGKVKMQVRAASHPLPPCAAHPPPPPSLMSSAPPVRHLHPHASAPCPAVAAPHACRLAQASEAGCDALVWAPLTRHPRPGLPVAQAAHCLSSPSAHLAAKHGRSAMCCWMWTLASRLASDRTWQSSTRSPSRFAALLQV